MVPSSTVTAPLLSDDVATIGAPSFFVGSSGLPCCYFCGYGIAFFVLVSLRLPYHLCASSDADSLWGANYNRSKRPQLTLC